MATYVQTLPSANISRLSSAVSDMQVEVSSLDQQVGSLSSHAKSIENSTNAFLDEFHKFIEQNKKDQRLHEAIADQVQLQQELETKFAQHQKARGYVTGILQATDLSLVRKQTMQDCTEELMLAVPHYWLVPALVALSAWLNNDKTLAERALHEALRRDDEKTTLLFCLIACRIGRKDVSSAWLRRYFAMQDPTSIEQQLVIVLDAYVNGLFGKDAQGMCANQLNEWISELEDTEGFHEEQVEKWASAISGKIPSASYGSKYPMLSKYTKQESSIRSTLNCAKLHKALLEYIESILNKQDNKARTLKQSLDSLLNSLVSSYDSEELPYREQERRCELIIECRGDAEEAERRLEAEKSSFNREADITQILINAATTPELVHASVSTQKLSLAVTKNWLIDGYKRIVERNRSQATRAFECVVDDFKFTTTDGTNETAISADAKQYCESKRDAELSGLTQSKAGYALLAGSAALTALTITSSLFFVGPLALVGSALFTVSKRKKHKEDVDSVYGKYQSKERDILNTVQGICAEVVDFRREVKKNDEEYEKTLAFLSDEVTPQKLIAT